MGKIKRGARTFKDNFWSKKRIEYGLTFNDLSKYLHIHSSAICHYFTGQQMPCDAVINELCTYFEVDPVEGKQEFAKAHEVWVGEKQRGTAVYSVKSRKRRKRRVVNTDEPADTVPSVPKASPVDTKSLLYGEYIRSLLYGKLSCDEYNALLEGNLSGHEILKYAYTKVSVDDFIELIRILDKEG